MKRFKEWFLHFVMQRNNDDYKTIYFNNGMRTKITIQVAEIIRDSTIKGCGNFQSFTDQDGDIYLIVNLSEVAYVA